MIKNKLDYKLVNICLITLIIYFLYKTGNLWTGVLGKIGAIFLPFLFGFAIAYAVHPFLERMIDKKIPKWLGIGIIVFVILALIAFVIYIVTTVLVGQLSNLFDSILKFLTNLSKMEFEINVSGLQTSLEGAFKDILSNIGTYVSNGTINLINTSLNVISKFFIGFAAFIYFLIDMDKIRESIKKILRKRSTRIYNYVAQLDDQMKKYLSGLIKITLISVFEYWIAYSIIGHPNALLLGFLAGIANLIPYFGGILVNILAAITAFVVGPIMFIKTLITFFICSTLDSYLINPAVYGKTNSIHPLLVIFALFAGSIVFGIMGVFISFPVAILIVTTYKSFKGDISKKVKETTKKRIKENID